MVEMELSRLEVVGAAAQRLRDALVNPVDDRMAAAERLLHCLSGLYAAALVLGPGGDDFGEPDLDEAFPVEADELKEVGEKLQTVFGERRWYWLQHDPIFPRDGTEKPVCGDLVDDLLDIYGDIVPALRAWEAGTNRIDDIVFEWRGTLFQTHWGVHATQAIRALHFIVFDHGLGEPIS